MPCNCMLPHTQSTKTTTTVCNATQPVTSAPFTHSTNIHYTAQQITCKLEEPIKGNAHTPTHIMHRYIRMSLASAYTDTSKATPLVCTRVSSVLIRFCTEYFLRCKCLHIPRFECAVHAGLLVVSVFCVSIILDLDMIDFEVEICYRQFKLVAVRANRHYSGCRFQIIPARSFFVTIYCFVLVKYDDKIIFLIFLYFINAVRFSK